MRAALTTALRLWESKAVDGEGKIGANVRQRVYALASRLLAGALVAAVWTGVSSSNASKSSQLLTAGAITWLSAATATSWKDAWAVGQSSAPRGKTTRTVIEHWNGTAWKLRSSPNVAIHNFLADVAAVSAGRAWAVGYSYGTPAHRDSGPPGPLIERWNGAAWKVVAGPNVEADLAGVAATSATNAWAVGFSSGRTLIEHWNGSTWKLQPSPNVGAGPNQLVDVAATSATNAWAVGFRDTSSAARPLIEHWNGKVWKVQSIPKVGIQLQGVAATSASNAWAVGGSLIERWNGKAWKVESSPDVGIGLYGVAAISGTDAWAVGHRGDRPVIVHWDGTAWEVQSGPAVSGSSLQGVAATSADNAWAVGLQGGSHSRTLIEHWDQTAWEVQPSPNP